MKDHDIIVKAQANSFPFFSFLLTRKFCKKKNSKTFLKLTETEVLFPAVTSGGEYKGKVTDKN